MTAGVSTNAATAESLPARSTELSLARLATVASMLAGVVALWMLVSRARAGAEQSIVPASLLVLVLLQIAALRASAAARMSIARKLAESDRRLEALFHSNLLGLAIRDRHGRVTAINATLRSIIGDDGELATPAGADALTRAGAAAPRELEVVSKDGSRIDLLTASTETTDREETIDCVIDISQWKKASRALIAARAVLEQTTTDLRRAPALAATEMAVAGVQPAKPSPEPVNTEVESLVLRLATANRELEAFSYSVSHDLRTPLRAIDGFSRALLDHYSSTLDVRGRDYLARICNAAQRMAQLIDDLLKLARVSRSDLKRQRLDLTQEALTVVDLLRSAHPAREVSVTVASDLIVDADLRLLRIILENLLGNAWKFTARTENASITLGSRVIDGASVFFVADNGAGFDMAYADQLFGVFQRLHSTDQFEGTGVGLATVQRVLQMHGGRIWAEAAVDRGATFFFTFESPSLQAQNYERGVA